MIDWSVVLPAALWLLGLALVVATLSYTDYVGAAGRLTLSGLWRQVSASVWANGGLALFCCGMVFSAGSWLERGGWTILALALLYNVWRLYGSQTPGALSTSYHASGAKPVATSGKLQSACDWIIKTELIWLALLAPFFIFPAPARVLPLIGLPLLWLCRRVARGRFTPRTPFDWAIALLLLMALISLLVTPDFSFSYGKVTGLLYGVGLYYGLVEWASNGRRLPQLLTGFMISGIGLTLVGLVGTTWPNKIPFIYNLTTRLPSLIRGLPGAEEGIQVNELAGSLLLILPLQLAIWGWAAFNRTLRRRAVLLGALSVMALLLAATLALTQSRSALLGLVCALGLMIWLALPRTRTLLLVAVGVALVAGLAYLTATDKLPGIVDSIVGIDTPVGSGAAIGRAGVWLRAIRGIQDFPLTGMGMNSFRVIFPALYPIYSIPNTTSALQDYGHAHNQFLQAALDLGLPGLVAFLAIWIIAIVVLVATWRKANDSLSRAITLGVGGPLLAFFIFGLTDTVALGAKPGVFFWGLLALLVTIYQKPSNIAPAPEPED